VKLSQWLKLNNLSQKDFGNMLGIRQQSVGRYLHGFPPKRNIAFEIIKLTGGKVQLADLWPIRRRLK
jgi:hypothetical protein